MIVFTMGIGELIGLAITGVLVLVLIGIHICGRLTEFIDNWRLRK